MRRIVLVSLWIACAPAERAGSPESTWRDFSKAYARAEIDTVWQLLSKDSQTELTRAAKEIAIAEGRTAPADGRRLAFTQGSPFPKAIARVKVVEEQADRAILEITDEAGTSRQALVVKEGAAWRVDVSDVLRNAVK